MELFRQISTGPIGLQRIMYSTKSLIAGAGLLVMLSAFDGAMVRTQNAGGFMETSE
jgi:hypothetical protein